MELLEKIFAINKLARPSGIENVVAKSTKTQGTVTVAELIRRSSASFEKANAPIRHFTKLNTIGQKPLGSLLDPSWAKAAAVEKSALKFAFADPMPLYKTKKDPYESFIRVNSNLLRFEAKNYIPISKLNGTNSVQQSINTLQSLSGMLAIAKEDAISQIVEINDGDVDVLFSTSVGSGGFVIQSKLLTGRKEARFEVKRNASAIDFLISREERERTSFEIAGQTRRFISPNIFEILKQKQLPSYQKLVGYEPEILIVQRHDGGEEAVGVGVKENAQLLVAVIEGIKDALKYLQNRIKDLYRQLRSILKIDIKHFIRIVIRCVRMTTLDGKESDSVTVIKPTETVNTIFKNLISSKCLLKTHSYRWYTTPSPI